jgi:hypothetical protein
MRDDSDMADAKRIYESMVLTAWADGTLQELFSLGGDDVKRLMANLNS